MLRAMTRAWRAASRPDKAQAGCPTKAPMSEDETPPALHFAPEATKFESLTLAFDSLFRWGEAGVSRLEGRRFLRCNLTGPALVALGAGNSFTDNIFSGCSFIVAPEENPVPGVIRLEDCSFEDCIITRWAFFMPPRLAMALARDMPETQFLGLPSALW